MTFVLVIMQILLVAERISTERGECIGESVGYKVNHRAMLQSSYFLCLSQSIYVFIDIVFIRLLECVVACERREKDDLLFA